MITVYSSELRDIDGTMYLPTAANPNRASPVARWQRIHLRCRSLRRLRFNPLGLEDPLEEDIAAHSSILAWRIPWTEKPGDLQS